MEYHIAKPSLPLSRFIKHYWAIENCMPHFQGHTQRVVPSGLVELLFYLSDKPVSSDENKSIDENAFIMGHLREFYDIRIAGRLSLFSIQFKPHGLSLFFDIPLNEFYNQNVPLKYIVGHDANELETKLHEANSFDTRIKVVESYLLGLLNKKLTNHHFNRIEQSIQIINQTRGAVDINVLASEACLSRKQFERVFAQYVGASPKQFLRTIRFQNTINIKSDNKIVSLTDLTYSCGYYDQSHMANDFQKLSGMTPKQYFNNCAPYSDYFQ